MNEQTGFKGVFDRTSLGKTTDPLTFSVEKGRIAFFCEVVGETNPIHFDEEAAKAAGFPAIVAPPTFPMVIDLDTSRIYDAKGGTSLFALANCDLRYLLHGSEKYEFSTPIFAGDELTITHEITGFSDKRGGALEICHVRGSITHPERGEVAAILRDMIHRLG